MRDLINLNYSWRFHQQFSAEHIHPEYNDETFETVQIPHTNREVPYHYFDEQMYQGISCYRKKIYIPKKEQGRVFFLAFEAVGHVAEIYVNGEFVGSHKGGYTPFKIDVTNYVTFDHENVIVVKVDSTEREDVPPFGHAVDYLTFGGIYREVWLEVVHPAHMEHVFIETRNILNEKKELLVRVQCSQAVSPDTQVKCYLYDKEEQLVCEFQSTKQKDGVIQVSQGITGIMLWDLDNPYLYRLDVMLIQDGEVLDVVSETVGFRHAIFEHNGFYLNGKKIKLRGLNRHQSYPYVGYAMPKSAQEEDAYLLKDELGCNIVRTSHYPQSKHFIRCCDEIGLLVFTEIPGWQHISEREDWREVLLNNVEEMVVNYYNHPSIILWGVRVNESNDCDELYEKTNALARKLDKTRQTGGVRYLEGSNLLEDVYTYNDFLHNGRNLALKYRRKVTKKTVPYLVTEYNGHMYPTKRFDQESKRTEHLLRHARVLDKLYSDDEITGAIGWCMADYYTHKDFGSGDRICYHGVLDMFRIPKLAASVYAAQSRTKPVLEITSDMNVGEYDGSFIGKVYAFTNCDYIELYKNNVFVNRFYRNKRDFSHIPFAPILIDDFIGDEIFKEKGYSRKTLESIKKILVQLGNYGWDDLPLKYKLKMLVLLVTGRVSVEQGNNFYGKYSRNWGEILVEYRFDGFMDNKLVASIKKAPVFVPRLYVKDTNLSLIEGDTYDVKRIELSAIDESGCVLPYCNDVIQIDTEGPIQVVGPTIFSLIGGVRACWIKTIGQSGEGIIRISSQQLGSIDIAYDVTKVEQPIWESENDRRRGYCGEAKL